MYNSISQCSTTSTGYSVIDSKYNVLSAGTISLKRSNSLVENSAVCSKSLRDIYDSFNNASLPIDKRIFVVGIEKPMKSFRNQWNTTGLIALAQV